MASKKIFQKDIYAFVLFFLFWFGLFFYSGSISSGYHLIDDHEIINLNEKLNHTDVFSTTTDYTLMGFEMRFRPIYWIERSALTKLFGLNFTLWEIFFGILAVLTSFFLYKFFLTIGFSYSCSLLFSFLTLVGPQSVIWYQLADVENGGMFFLSLSLFFLAKSLYSARHNIIYRNCFIITLILSSFSKESFILIIPAVTFCNLWLYAIKKKVSFYISIKKNLVFILLILSLMILEIIFILFYVGTAKMGYAGIDNHFNMVAFLRDFFYRIRHERILLVILFGLFLLILNKFTSRSKTSVSEISNKLLPAVILSLLVIIPQYVLYFKSGFSNRYYLPMMMGFTFFVIYIINDIKVNNTPGKITKAFYYLLVIIFLYFQFTKNTYPDIKAFSDDGKNTNSFLKSIEQNTNGSSAVLIVMDPVQNYEQGLAVASYLKNVSGFKKYYAKFEYRKTIAFMYSDINFYNSIENTSKEYFENNTFAKIQNSDEIKCIAIFPKLEEIFLDKNKDWFSNDKFDRMEFGKNIIYYRK